MPTYQSVNRGAAMLKPDDPAWGELVADIKAVMSSRCEDGDTFASLHRLDQWDFFNTSGFYNDYADLGITDTQVTTVIRNALNGKPQERWLEGIFKDMEKVAWQEIMQKETSVPEPARTHERGGLEDTLTAEEQARLFKEIVADTEAGKREDAHPRGKDAYQEMLNAKSEACAVEKGKDKGIER